MSLLSPHAFRVALLAVLVFSPAWAQKRSVKIVGADYPEGRPLSSAETRHSLSAAGDAQKPGEAKQRPSQISVVRAQFGTNTPGHSAIGETSEVFVYAEQYSLKNQSPPKGLSPPLSFRPGFGIRSDIRYGITGGVRNDIRYGVTDGARPESGYAPR